MIIGSLGKLFFIFPASLINELFFSGFFAETILYGFKYQFSDFIGHNLSQPHHLCYKLFFSAFRL